VANNLHLAPAHWPHENLAKLWEDAPGYGAIGGSTQPWVAALLYQLVRALDIRNVAELGCYKGVTSSWLACAIEENSGGRLTLVDCNAQALKIAQQWIETFAFQKTTIIGVHGATLIYLPDIPRDTQLIFLDDDKKNILQKVAMLRGLGVKALLAIHDAEGLPEMKELGALVLPTPPMHSTGHLALVQL
jgi:predicted O-methyltransferase YrrM